MDEHLLQPQQLFFAIASIAVRADKNGVEQTDVVIVVQRPDRHAGKPRQFTHSICRHPTMSPQDRMSSPSRRVRVKREKEAATADGTWLHHPRSCRCGTLCRKLVSSQELHRTVMWSL